MKRTRLRRWTILLALVGASALAVALPLAGSASGQFFFQPQCVAGSGFTAFPGTGFGPCNTPFVTNGLVFNAPTFGAQPFFSQPFAQPVFFQPALPYPGFRGVFGDPYGFVTSPAYAPAAGPEEQQQQQQQAVQAPGVVVTQSQQQQQQQSGRGGGYGFWGGGSDQQEQQQEQQIS